MSNSVVLERLSSRAERHSPASLKLHKRKRVYIFLTRYGFIFGLNLFVMLMGSVNYNNSLGYALTFLLSALFMVSMLHTYVNLRGLIISVSEAEPVFAGQKASFPFLLDNKFSPHRLAIELRVLPKIKKRLQRSAQNSEVSSVDIDAQTIKSLGLSVPAPKRGYLKPGRVKISSTWPLGLFRAWSYVEFEHACIVYPLPQGAKKPPGVSLIDEEEEQTGKNSGTEDFTGFRQYRIGDSMRAVDWKAYAREGGLISKRFSGKGTKKILIDWDQTSHLADIELRLSQLCLWILEAAKEQAQFALVMPGDSQPHVDGGEKHKRLCLEALALYGINDEQV